MHDFKYRKYIQKEVIIIWENPYNFQKAAVCRAATRAFILKVTLHYFRFLLDLYWPTWHNTVARSYYRWESGVQGEPREPTTVEGVSLANVAC